MSFVRIALGTAQCEEGEWKEFEDFGRGIGLGYGGEKGIFLLGRSGVLGRFDFAEGAFDYYRNDMSTFYRALALVNLVVRTTKHILPLSIQDAGSRLQVPTS